MINFIDGSLADTNHLQRPLTAPTRTLTLRIAKPYYGIATFQFEIPILSSHVLISKTEDGISTQEDNYKPILQPDYNTNDNNSNFLYNYPYNMAQQNSDFLQNHQSGTAFENLLNYLMVNDPNKHGNPPASKEVVKTLPMLEINSEEELNKIPEIEKDCSVCKEMFKLGSKIVRMPCDHLYHDECILQWLELHNNCLVCRYELATDDPDYEKRKEKNRSVLQNMGKQKFEHSLNKEITKEKDEDKK